MQDSDYTMVVGRDQGNVCRATKCQKTLQCLSGSWCNVDIIFAFPVTS